ncbi:MAG TPA: hypothetical protein DDY68_06080 [Porphyromonadaceae bacterium]|nr:hypothetical protein [Porphyromonadaceae bacterium]
MKVFQNFPKGKKMVKGTEPTSEKVLTNTTQSHNTNPLHNEAIKIVNEYVRLHGFNPKNRCFGVIDFDFKTEGKEGV